MLGAASFRRAGSPLVLVFAAVLIALLLICWRSETDAPEGARTPFNADAAITLLNEVLPAEPHPAGSRANYVFRDRLIQRLETYGYAARVQRAFQCAQGNNPGCAFVENIIAEKRGESGRAVMVSAHYDSAAAAPGGGDDGLGVAVLLALAQQVASAPQTTNGTIFLLTDAEEAGLRGAYAFAQDPMFKRVGAVINLDARGASGPAVMFETGPNNAGLVGRYAGGVARPVANSATVEIYKRMPNDTDFSVFRRAGISGLNFAVVGSASLYHSARDTPAKLDRDTVQHMGDSVFAAARALTGTDLTALSQPGDASHFDLFGRAMIAWPSSLDLPLALIAFVAIVGLCWARRNVFGWRDSALSIGAVIAVPAALFAVGWVLSFPLGVWPGAHPLDHPQPWPGRIALIAAMLAVGAAIGGLIQGGAALTLIVWLVLSALGVGVAAMAPGAAYALLWPALLFAVEGWITVARGREGASPALFGFAAIAFFWTAHFLMGEAVLGFAMSHWRMLTLAPIALALAPLFASRPEAWRVSAAGAAGAMVIAAIAAATSPAYTPERPRGVNLVYTADPWSPPRWQVIAFGPQDEAFLKQAGFSANDRPYTALDGRQALGRFKPAAELQLPPPNWNLRTAGRQGDVATVDAVISPARDGFSLGLVLPENSGVTSVSAEGQEVLAIDGRRAASASFAGLSGRPVRLSITFDAAQTPKIVLFERAPLPQSQEAQSLAALRPANAAPAYNGDYALVAREIVLTAP